MDKDVEAKSNRFCERYLQAEAHIHLLKPNVLPTQRRQRQLERSAVAIMQDLRKARKPAGTALVRLAYVRALRGINSQERLDDEMVQEAEHIAGQLDLKLRRLEVAQMLQFRQLMRDLKTRQVLCASGVPAELAQFAGKHHERFSLEQRARASVRWALEMAATAGTLAATKSASYDTAE